MLKVYLLRHGLTDWNKLRRVQGSSDIPLNEEGRRVARLTAEGMRDMPIDLVYSSPLKRARETAEIICAGRDVPIVFDERIREIGFGEFEGVTWPEIYENEECAGFRKFFFDPDNYVPERGAESIEKVIARGKSFLEEREEIRMGIIRKPRGVQTPSFTRKRVWNTKEDMSLGLLLPAKQKLPRE